VATIAVDAPAGWYADPLGDAVLRWWDETGWTEHTSAVGGPAPQRSFSGAQLPAPDPGAAPVIPPVVRVPGTDWRALAAELRALDARNRPTVVHLELDDLDPIVVDIRYHAYGWRRPLSELPALAHRAEIVEQHDAPLAPTVFQEHSGPLTELVELLEHRRPV